VDLYKLSVTHFCRPSWCKLWQKCLINFKWKLFVNGLTFHHIMSSNNKKLTSLWVCCILVCLFSFVFSFCGIFAVDCRPFWCQLKNFQTTIYCVVGCLYAKVQTSKQAAGSSLEMRKEHLMLHYVFCRVIVVCGNFLVAISCWFIIIIMYPTQPIGRKWQTSSEKIRILCIENWKRLGTEGGNMTIVQTWH